MPSRLHDLTGAGVPGKPAPPWAWVTDTLDPAFAHNAPLLVICAAAAAFLLLPAAGRMAARRALFRKTRAQIDAHLDTLMRRRAQLVQKDPYGRIKLDKWDKEIAYFVAHQIAPLLSPAQHAALGRHHARIAALIEATTATAQAEQPDAPDDMTPVEFENYCARSLCDAGWDARVTQQSRDQGVDVIAEKDRLRIVLQCKLYSRPVGNKSVQEAASARLHEQADFAAVVSNNRFTPAAEQLAASTGVLLLHYRDLPTLAGRLAERTMP